MNQLVDRAGKWATIRALQRDENPSNLARQHLGEIEDLVEQIRSKKDDAEEAAEGARVAAQRAGAGAFTKLFQDEADRTLGLSKWWGGATGVAAVITIVAALAMAYWFPLPAGDWPQVLPSAGFRVVALSMLIYTVSWCSRACLANLHLATTNGHRALGIQTLQAFRSSAADSATKDAVVLEAARAVYEHVPSGYLSKRSGDQPLPRVVDAVRSLGSAGG